MKVDGAIQQARLFDDRPCHLGEGGLWHPIRQEFFWFDILGKTLRTKAKSWSFSHFASAAGWIDKNRLLIATSAALVDFNLETGIGETLVDLEAHDPTTRSNDGRADPLGGFWIGTMGTSAEAGAGAIYRYHRGELRRLFAPITIPNSICFSPDGGRAYFTDTPTQIIHRVDLDGDGWPRGEPEVWLTLAGTPWRPDGSVTDAAGNVWNAQWGGHRVAAYDPDARFLHAISAAASQTSCPAFGGADLTDLYITSATEGMSDPAPQEGRTYLAENAGRGRPEPRVIPG